MPFDERLTRHFFLSQLTVSPMLGRAGLRNEPRGQQFDNLRRLAQTLEVVRAQLNGAQVCVLGAFRQAQQAPLPGRGDAPAAGRSVEFIAPEFGSPRDICLQLRLFSLGFDRLVNAAGMWVYLEIPEAGAEPRRQVQTGVFEFAAPMRYLEGLL